MQKLMVFILVVFVGMQAHAFGGGGDNRLFDKEWMRGVDAFALHFNGKGELDIKFSCDDKNASPDIHGVCSCKAGYQSENGKCVQNACANFQATECIKTCTSSNGVATYTYGTVCSNGYFCNTNHQCENPCYEDECQTCTPIAGQARWTNKTNGTTCSIGSCQSGTCTDMCTNKTLGECDASCHPATGVLTPKSSTALCGTDNNWHCDGNHNCVDPCAGQTAPACQKCVAVNGQATFVADDTQTTCHNGAYVCQSGACVNPCDSATYGECEQCTAVNGAAQISNKDTTAACGENGNYRCDGAGVCADPCKDAETPECHECYVEQGVAKFRPISDTTCGTDDNYICQSGTCTDPCTIGEHATFEPTVCFPAHHAENGQCVPDYALDTTVCPDGNGSDNYICQSGNCTDPCTIGDHNVCTLWKAQNGLCVEDGFAEKGTKNCDTTYSDYVCNGQGVCTCPEGTFRDSLGYCRFCSNTPPYETTAEECALCDNTSTPRMMWAYNGKNYCVLATCPEGRFHRYDGGCYSCSDKYSYETTAEACAACDNTSTPRKMWAYNGKNYCALATCPEGFHLNNGYCYSCSITSFYETTAEVCAECDGTSNPRFMGTNDRCYPCTDADSFITTADVCQKCGSIRTWTELIPASGTTPAKGTCALAE